MPESRYGAKQCAEHAVTYRADWGRIKPLDPGAGALGRELEAVRLIARGRATTRRSSTRSSPRCRSRASWPAIASSRICAGARGGPPALEAITETMVRYAAPRRRRRRRSVLRDPDGDAGDGHDDESERFGAAYDARVLAAVKPGARR